MNMPVMIPAKVIDSTHEGVTVTVKTVRGDQQLIMDPFKVLPGMDLDAPPDPALEAASWMGAWLEHRLVCPACDKGNKPMCARAEEIAKHLPPARNPQSPFEKWS